MIDVWLRNITSRLSKQSKWAFVAAFIIGLLVHSFIFFNHYHTHDSFSNIHEEQNKTASGRFFLQYASMWSSYFDLPWVNGVFSLFYLSVVALLIVILLDIQKNSTAIVIGGVVVAFPTVTSTFSYMFTADGYMLGILVAISALVVTKLWHYGWLVGILLTYISVGIYQANLTIILAFICVFALQQLLIKGHSVKALFVQSGQMLIVFTGGMALYLIHYKIYQMQGLIVSYQGLDTAGIPSLSEMWALRYTIHEQMLKFFFEGLYTVGALRTWDFLHIVLAMLLILFTVYFSVQQKLYKHVGKLLLTCIIIALIPIAYYAVYFTSGDVQYHMLMVYANVTVYVLALCFFDKVDVSMRMPIKIAASTTWLSVIAVVINFGIIANIAYFNMNIKYEKSFALADRVLMRIEALENYHEVKNIAVLGYTRLHSPLTSIDIPEAIPSITGSSGEIFLPTSFHYQKLYDVYYGVQLKAADAQQIERIQKTTQFKQMDVWPNASSVQVIDGTAVVKFREMD